MTMLLLLLKAMMMMMILYKQWGLEGGWTHVKVVLNCSHDPNFSHKMDNNIITINIHVVFRPRCPNYIV